MIGTARCSTFRHYPSAFILVLTIDRLWSTLMCRQWSCIVGKHRCVNSGHVSKPTFTASSQHSQLHSYLPVLLYQKPPHCSPISLQYLTTQHFFIQLHPSALPICSPQHQPGSGKHQCVDSGHVSRPTFTASSQRSR
jgi:hypothetical protein